jgi:CRP-like cAMP-binding protein
MVRPALAVESQTTNRLLAALPADDYRRLEPELTCIPLPQHTLLETPDRPTDRVYFPWDGVCSFTTLMQDGGTVEVATIGNEGVVGMSVYFGGQLPGVQTIVQVPGAGATMMRAGTFTAEMDRRGALYELVRRYSQALLTLMTQSVACNALHEVDQRCARWLLLTHDRVEGDTLLLTQEYLATMLGVRRPTVTVVARRLQEEGLIDYRRGRIVIRDRPGLARLSCECYGVVRSHFARLLP